MGQAGDRPWTHSTRRAVAARRTRQWIVPALALLVWILAVASPTAGQSHASESARSPTAPPAPVSAATVQAHATRAALELGDRFGSVPLLWAHADTPAAHEVVLLRGHFDLGRREPATELLVWADTRYTAWLDGRPLGRGPARFSAGMRFYDVLSVPPLAAGRHVLALRVQWAPNLRRSVSTRPQAAARLQRPAARTGPRVRQVLAQTGPHWRAWAASAWLADSVPVHALGLLGPAEVLDLRLLPQAWREPDFDDSSWSPAFVLGRGVGTLGAVSQGQAATASAGETSSTISTPPATPPASAAPTAVPGPRWLRRDVALPVDVPVVPRLLSRGRLSPGSTLLHLPAPDREGVTDTFSTTLFVSGSTSLTVTLTSLLAPPEDRSLGEPDAPGPAQWRGPQATLDGQPIVWSASAGLDQGERGPADAATRDHVSAALKLDPGEHRLRVSPLPADGLPLAVAPAAVAATAVAAGPAPHPGRRLLLARPEPVENGAQEADAAAAPIVAAGPAVTVTRHAAGLDIHFGASPSYVVLDLGRTTVGRLSGTAEGPPGATLDVGWDERLAPATSWPLPHPGSLHPAWSQVDSLTLDGGARAIESLDARAGRYVLIAAWQSPIVLRDLIVHDTRSPMRQRGWLQTGDAQLDALWQIGAETVRANSSDVYADPWRERGLWWGDAWAVQRAANVVFGADTLRRRGLRLMAEPLAAGELVGFAPRGDQSRVRDYPLLWLLDLAEHQRWGADDTLLEETWPAVVTLMTRLEAETVGRRVTTGSDPSRDAKTVSAADAAAGSAGEGLLTLAEGPWHRSSFIDWAAGPARYGLSAPLNALYVDGLAAAAELATLRGEPERAARWARRAADTAAALREALWLPEARRFATSRLDGVLVPPSAHAQAWPLAQGLVPAADMAAVAAALEELLVPESPVPGDRDLPTVELYGFHWVLEAYGRSGRVDLGLAAMRRWHAPLLERGLSTWPESWTADERWDAALSHGWGAAPTVFLTRWLLGARRVEEHAWRLRPGWSGPVAVEGALPLAQGSLRVRWVRVGCTAGVVEIDAPRGTHGAIELPRAPDMRLWLDDRAIRVGADDGDVVTVPLAPPSTAQGDGPTDPRFMRVPLAQGRHRIVVMPLGEPLCRR